MYTIKLFLAPVQTKNLLVLSLLVLLISFSCEDQSNHTDQQTSHSGYSDHEVAPENILAVNPMYEAHPMDHTGHAQSPHYTPNPTQNLQKNPDFSVCDSWTTKLIHQQPWLAHGQSLLVQLSARDERVNQQSVIPWICWQPLALYESEASIDDMNLHRQWGMAKEVQTLHHWIWVIGRHSQWYQTQEWLTRFQTLLSMDQYDTIQSPYVSVIVWDEQGAHTHISYSKDYHFIVETLHNLFSQSRAPSVNSQDQLTVLRSIDHAIQQLSSSHSTSGITTVWSWAEKTQLERLYQQTSQQNQQKHTLTSWLDQYSIRQTHPWHWIVWEQEESLTTQLQQKHNIALEHMNTQFTHQYYRLGLCPNTEKSYSRFASLPFVPHLKSTALNQDLDSSYCQINEIIHRKKRYPLRLSMQLTASQKEIYQQRLQDNSKESFEASLQAWGTQGSSVAIQAKLRGKGSLRCRRRNYKIQLPTGKHHLIPFSEQREYYLISMCLDQGYVNQLFGSALLSYLGVFPLNYRLVLLEVDGEEKGIYFLVDRPADAIPQRYPSTQLLLRRGTDIDGKADEVKYSTINQQNAYADYSTWRDLARSIVERSPDELWSWLSLRLDIPEYLTWIAANTLMRNGDYIDEVWFYALQGADLEANTRWQYHVIAWDTDDLFSECHYGGGYAIDVMGELLYCTESILDHAIFDHPMIQEVYVAQLASAIEKLSDEFIEAIYQRIHTALMSLLADEKISAAMIELQRIDPHAKEPVVAQRIVTQLLGDVRDQLLASKISLSQSIIQWQQ